MCEDLPRNSVVTGYRCIVKAQEQAMRGCMCTCLACCRTRSKIRKPCTTQTAVALQLSLLERICKRCARMQSQPMVTPRTMSAHLKTSSVWSLALVAHQRVLGHRVGRKPLRCASCQALDFPHISFRLLQAGKYHRPSMFVMSVQQP